MKHNCFLKTLAHTIQWTVVISVISVLATAMIKAGLEDHKLGLFFIGFFITIAGVGWSIDYLETEERREKRCQSLPKKRKNK